MHVLQNVGPELAPIYAIKANTSITKRMLKGHSNHIIISSCYIFVRDFI